LNSQDAEQLVQVALKDGRPARAALDEEQLAACAMDLRDGIMQSRFDDFVGEEAARHEDRAETGLARLDQQQSKRTRDVEHKLWQWKMSGDPKKLKLVPAEQGKLDRLIARLSHKREELLQARDRFAFQQDLIGFAVVTVGAGQ
jgi:hypothetical protein